MRNLIFAINVSADGCCDHSAFNPGVDVLDYFTQLNRDTDTLMYGRKTYELMVPFWPEMAENFSGDSQSEIDFALSFASVPQMIVFSKTLKAADGKNTTILRDNLKEEIQKLKREPGKNILTGGVSLPAELLKLGLIDEIRLLVHPVVVGKGRRLFDEVNLQANQHLKLVESKVFESGSIALQYMNLASDT